jgi:hypothetical protein
LTRLSITDASTSVSPPCGRCTRSAGICSAHRTRARDATSAADTSTKGSAAKRRSNRA